MRARSLVVPALALALAGCGGDDKKSGTAASDDPCARPAGFHALKGEIPSGIAPGGTFVSEVKRSGGTTNGELYFTGGVVDTYQTLRAGIQSRGYQLTADDQEGFEAEVGGRSPSGGLSFKVLEIQGCSSASRGHFVLVRGSD